MKKIIIAGLVAFALLSVGGTASAWDIDLEGWVEDVDIDLTFNVNGFLDDYNDDEVYSMTSTLGVDGEGYIDIDGDSTGGHRDYLDTDIWNGKGTFYATQTVTVVGDLEECVCPPGYLYHAEQGAWINGRGEIDLDQTMDADDCEDEHQQSLEVCGVGDFKAGMKTYSLVDWCDEPVPVEETHAFGISGENVKFNVHGFTHFDEMYGDAGGTFNAFLRFRDCGCDDGGCGC